MAKRIAAGLRPSKYPPADLGGSPNGLARTSHRDLEAKGRAGLQPRRSRASPPFFVPRPRTETVDRVAAGLPRHFPRRPCAAWRSELRLVRIRIHATGYDLRLRRLLCGKASPFRPRPLLYNLISPARRLRLRAGEIGIFPLTCPGKAEPFRRAEGIAPPASANLDSAKVNSPLHEIAPLAVPPTLLRIVNRQLDGGG